MLIIIISDSDYYFFLNWLIKFFTKVKSWFMTDLSITQISTQILGIFIRAINKANQSNFNLVKAPNYWLWPQRENYK